MPIEKYIKKREEEFAEKFKHSQFVDYSAIQSFNSETIATVLRMVREMVEEHLEHEVAKKDDCLSDILSSIPNIEIK